MKRFAICQALALLALGIFWIWGPKNHVAKAELTAVAQAPSESSLGNYAAAADTQFTGTIGRGFQDRRVAEAVVQKHPELGLDASSLVAATTVSVNAFSRTLRLEVAAASPPLACTSVAALLEERRALDARLWHEAQAAALQRVEQSRVSLEAQLRQQRVALQALGEDVGDPLERDARLREHQRKTAVIENIKADMTLRARQFHHMQTLLATAIQDLRAGREVPPSSGFELSETSVKRDGAGRPADSLPLISKRSSGMSEAWSELLKNATELAATEAVYGSRHPQVVAAVATLAGSRNRLLTELLAQQEVIGVASASLKASDAWLEQEMTALHDEVRALNTARFNPDDVKLRQTISGLESALHKTGVQRQRLASAALTQPPQFYVTDPPVETSLPVQPTFLACFITAQVAVMALLWMISPWTEPRRR